MKHFGIEEANATLEALRPLAKRMVSLRRDVLQFGEKLARVRQGVAGNGSSLDARAAARLEKRVVDVSQELARTVQEIEAFGVQVKDLDRGLVDFPARHPVDDRTVLLCWQFEEATVGYWHGLEEGFTGRKPLPF